MNAPPRARLDLTWTPQDLAALLLLCAVLAAATVWRSNEQTVFAEGTPPADPARVEAAAEKINPNDATIASLRRLPGIGPRLAAAIVAHRGAHRAEPFRHAEDLAAAKGIGSRTAQRLAPWLSLPRRTAQQTTSPRHDL